MDSKTDNELIAEFMGLRVHTSAGVLWYCDDDGWVDWVDGADPYSPDRSWNDLMPVLEKIRPLAFTVDIDSTAWRRVSGLNIFSKKEDVYRAVVEFIKWYRSQPEGNTVNMK